MLLAVDVGNTQSHVGVFDDHQLAAHWRFATEADDTADELAVRVSALVALEAVAFVLFTLAAFAVAVHALQNQE